VPQLKNETSIRSPECEILETWIPSQPKNSYRAALRDAFIQRFTSWYLSPLGSDQLEKEKEWTLLAILLFHNPPRASTLTSNRWRNLTRQPQIIRVLRHALRAIADQRRRGRAIGAKRRVAALALDLQSDDPERWTWRSLTNHLCNCGLAVHPPNSTCQKDLRRETVWLKDWLRTHGIEVTQRNNR
jgi:hypothetical protein